MSPTTLEDQLDNLIEGLQMTMVFKDIVNASFAQSSNKDVHA